MSSIPETPEKRQRQLPGWLKTTLPGGQNYLRLKSLVRGLSLHTVCESASCPNLGECWNAGTLTLMILGGTCTRACRFCDVPTGHLRPPDPEEPARVAGMLSELALRYAVITSVDRDDLADGGAAHWAETIRRVRVACADMKLEALIPDFRGEAGLIETVCESGPDILAHNVETVASLQAAVRPQCRYSWSMDTLRRAARMGLITKSGLMLGLGEKKDEVLQTMEELAQAGCRLLSLGQYLRPTAAHMEVVEYIHPDVFAEYKALGEAMGLSVQAGPLVRSSYRADLQAAALNPPSPDAG